MGEENKRAVYFEDTKVFVKRIFRILDLLKQCNPKKYGDLNTDLTKSYISRKTVTVTMYDGSFDNPYCEFPTEWLKLEDGEILIRILTENE
jgi:hypothetical protein